MTTVRVFILLFILAFSSIVSYGLTNPVGEDQPHLRYDGKLTTPALGFLLDSIQTDVSQVPKYDAQSSDGFYIVIEYVVDTEQISGLTGDVQAGPKVCGGLIIGIFGKLANTLSAQSNTGGVVIDSFVVPVDDMSSVLGDDVIVGSVTFGTFDVNKIGVIADVQSEFITSEQFSPVRNVSDWLTDLLASIENR